VSEAVLGSPNFMAPEQAAGQNRRLTTSADVYGLGAVLYALLTGRPPFEADSALETMRKVVEEEPVPPSRACVARDGGSANRCGSHHDSPATRIDADLQTVCLKCLEKKPERRYRSAEALAEDLERWLRHEPIRARPASAWERTAKWIRRKPALAGALVLLLVVLTGSPVAVFYINRERNRAEADLYVTKVRLASQDLQSRNLVSARGRLLSIAASPQQSPMRGWEWRYLLDQCRSEELTTLGRHASWISDLALSPDDRWVASISGDGWVKLWDLLGGTNPLPAWHAHTGPDTDGHHGWTHALAFSPSRQILATAGPDGKVRFWNVFSSPPADAFPPLEASCARLAFSPDGRLLAGLGRGGEACLWSISDQGAVLEHRWNATYWQPLALTFSADGKRLIAGGYQDPLGLWDVSIPSAPRKVRELSASVAPAATRARGSELYTTAAGKHALNKWNLLTLKEEGCWRTRSASLVALALADDGRHLAAGLGDGSIEVWDLTGGASPQPFMGHEDAVSFLAFARTRPLLVSASLDKTVRLWDPSGREDSSHYILRHGFSAITAKFSPDSRHLISVAREQIDGGERKGTEEHTAKLWEVETWQQLGHESIGGNNPSGDADFSTNGKLVAADDFDDRLSCFTVPTLTQVAQVVGHAVQFLRDGRSWIYASSNTVVRQSLPNGRPSRPTVIARRPDIIVHLAVSADDRVLAVVSKDDPVAIHFWDLQASGRYLGSSTSRHLGTIHRIAFSPDGMTLASIAWDGKLGLWDVATRRNKAMLPGHLDEAYGVAFSPDGRTIATAGTDCVRLWNVATLQEITTLTTDAMMGGLAFSPNGQWLAAAGNDGTIHVWKAPSMPNLGALRRP
jgi:WD40 repeat protein